MRTQLRAEHLMAGAMIAWVDHHGRSEGLAELLEIDAVFMPWARPGQPKVKTMLGWLRSTWRTVATVRSLPPGSLVVVQAPPVFAPMAARAAAGRRRAVVVDLHSGSFNDPRWRWSNGLMRRAARRCDAAIVTNLELVKLAGGELGDVIELHDPLTDRRSESVAAAPDPARKPYVVFPASGAADEPVEALVAAAAELAPDVDVLVTGRATEPWKDSAVRCTGFLAADDFDQLLRGGAAVLALTTRTATMQRAAYEALERGVPIVASRTDALVEALGDAAVFVDPAGPSIAKAVRAVVDDPAPYRGPGGKVLDAMAQQAEAAAERLHALAAERAGR